MQLDKIFARFKDLADRKKMITDADLEALVTEEVLQPREIYVLDGLQVTCGTMGMPTATIRLRDPEGNLQVHASVGAGPVDAAFKGINGIINTPATLQEFVVHAVTEGIDALGEVTVRIAEGDSSADSEADQAGDDEKSHTYGGYGADTDIVERAPRHIWRRSIKCWWPPGNMGLLKKHRFNRLHKFLLSRGEKGYEIQ